MRFFEIARIPQGDFGDKDTLVPMSEPRGTKPLPGGSGYRYTVQNTGKLVEILIFDQGRLIAELDLKPTNNTINSYSVETVATDPDYRGKGLGIALYGIALSVLKLTLQAGDRQTAAGQQMWIKLNSIPGVEVKGITSVPANTYREKPGDEILWNTAQKIVYSFPVEAGNRSMRSARRGTGVYGGNGSMIAKWTGQ
jgi:GNAT superfamily N-acetyltransferase